jgi:hypothetical protein
VPQKKSIETVVNEAFVKQKEMCQPNITSSDRLAVFTVPMKGPAPATTATTVEERSPKKAKVIDTAHLNEEDLQALKEQDPFLYYSIIQSNRSVDVMSSLLRGGIIPRRASCPSRIESTPTKVERRSCISFECHVDVFMENSEDDDELDVDSDAMFDRLLLQIRRNEKKQ